MKWNHTTFQIDTLIITAHGIYVYEIKNFSGEYLYKEELFQSVFSGEDFQSPLAQLNRSMISFRKLLETFRIQLPVNPFLTFVNSEFVLYQAPPFKTLLLPNSLPRHFRKLNSDSGSLSEQQYTMAEKLCALSANTVPIYTHLPEYNYEMLRKGASCSVCGNLFGEKLFRKRTCLCQKCGHTVSSSETTQHNIEEFQMLFPERKATPSALYKWCDEEIAIKQISAALRNLGS